MWSVVLFPQRCRAWWRRCRTNVFVCNRSVRRDFRIASTCGATPPRCDLFTLWDALSSYHRTNTNGNFLYEVLHETLQLSTGIKSSLKCFLILKKVLLFWNKIIKIWFKELLFWNWVNKLYEICLKWLLFWNSLNELHRIVSPGHCSVLTSCQVAPAEGFSDLAMQVMTSPSKNYILTMIGAGVALLFLTGLLCGRFTKRVTQELKDR